MILFQFTRVCCLLLVSMLLVACSSGGSATPEEAVETFVNALNAGDVDKIMEQIAFPPNMSKRESRKWLSDMAPGTKGNVKTFEILESRIARDGKTARVKFRVALDSGGDYVDDIPVFLIDGRWKILAIPDK